MQTCDGVPSTTVCPGGFPPVLITPHPGLSPTEGHQEQMPSLLMPFALGAQCAVGILSVIGWVRGQGEGAAISIASKLPVPGWGVGGNGTQSGGFCPNSPHSPLSYGLPATCRLGRILCWCVTLLSLAPSWLPALRSAHAASASVSS